ncbi:MAG: methyltransferase domain-containing protein [Cyclobacteriaceae bacterium]
MSKKYEPLTLKELNDFRLKPKIIGSIERYRKTNNLKPEEIRILDWGCGRGRSVLKLLQMGYDAYGVEIDAQAMSKSYDLFNNLGYSHKSRLMTIEGARLVKGFIFDFIFSEQVLEHVRNLEDVVNQMSGMAKIDAVGIHTFPGSRVIVEPHVFIPFVHWLPKNCFRKLYLYIYLKLFFNNLTNWPSLQSASLSEKVDTLNDYLNEKTYYRDVDSIVNIFEKHGFISDYNCPFLGSKRYPNFLKKNAFPKGDIILSTRKVQ